MPLLPPGSTFTLTFSGSSNTFYIDDVTFQYVTDPWERPEFSNEKLRNAKESNGAMPIIVETFGRLPIQLAITCTSSRARPLGPDTLSQLDSIKRKWSIRRYTFRSALCTSTAVDWLSDIATTHKRYLAALQAHIAKANSDISYTDLVSLQTDTIVSTLQSTGLTLTGAFLNGLTESNMLISDFQAIPSFEIPNATSGSDIYKTFSLTIENRVDSALSSTSS